MITPVTMPKSIDETITLLASHDYLAGRFNRRMVAQSEFAASGRVKNSRSWGNR
jgi:hypothetical protein